jgi:hypothetical protein
VTETFDGAGPKSGRFSRRSLIASSAGAVTTVAVTTIAPAAALAHDVPATPVAPPATPVPTNPVVAYVHDAARGEVTVLAGSAERTFRDPVLVKRLLAAADQTGAK